jgi:hypothetical protein
MQGLLASTLIFIIKNPVKSAELIKSKEGPCTHKTIRQPKMLHRVTFWNEQRGFLMIKRKKKRIDEIDAAGCEIICLKLNPKDNL